MKKSRPFIACSSPRDDKLGYTVFGFDRNSPLLRGPDYEANRPSHPTAFKSYNPQRTPCDLSTRYDPAPSAVGEHGRGLTPQGHVGAELSESLRTCDVLQLSLTPEEEHPCHGNGLDQVSTVATWVPGIPSPKFMISSPTTSSAQEHPSPWKEEMMGRVKSDIVCASHAISPTRNCPSNGEITDYPHGAIYAPYGKQKKGPYSYLWGTAALPWLSPIPKDHYSPPAALEERNYFRHTHCENKSASFKWTSAICKSPKEKIKQERLKQTSKDPQTDLDEFLVREVPVMNDLLASVRATEWKTGDDACQIWESGDIVARGERAMVEWDEHRHNTEGVISQSTCFARNSGCVREDVDHKSSLISSEKIPQSSGSFGSPMVLTESKFNSFATTDSLWMDYIKQPRGFMYSKNYTDYHPCSTKRNLDELSNLGYRSLYPNKICKETPITNKCTICGQATACHTKDSHEYNFGKYHTWPGDSDKASRKYTDKKSDIHHLKNSYHIISNKCVQKKIMSPPEISNNYMSNVPYVPSGRPSKPAVNRVWAAHQSPEEHQSQGSTFNGPNPLHCLANCFRPRRPRNSSSDSSLDLTSSSARSNTRSFISDNSLELKIHATTPRAGRQRKPQWPQRSPGAWDPSFRGVTVQMRTKITPSTAHLAIKAFFR